MNKKRKFEQILFYSRPWEVNLHLKIASQLQQLLPDTEIKFVTLFLKTVEVCRENNIECLYLPDLLAVCDDSYDEQLLVDIDGEIWAGFGTGLNAIINGERFLPGNQADISSFLIRHIRVISDLVKPGTLSISGMYDHFIYCLGGALANARQGVHIAFVGCGVPGGRVIPLKSPSTIWPAGGPDQHPVDMNAVADDIRNKLASQRIEYMRELDSEFKTVSDDFTFPFLVKRYFKRRRYMEYDYNHGSYFAIKNPDYLTSFIDKFLKLIPKKTVQYYDIDGIDDIEPNTGIYVALHMEPESTLLMYSPWLNDQLEFIRMLSVCLPSGFKIYVKENPKMIGVREKAYYQSLRGMPNVFIVNHSIESSKLIENTVLTASIAGTVVAEAFLLDKPTLCIGNPPVRELASFSLYDQSIADLRQFLEKICKGDDQDMIPDEAMKNEMFASWVEKSFIAKTVSVFEGDGELHVPYTDENAENYTNAIQSIYTFN